MILRTNLTPAVNRQPGFRRGAVEQTRAPQHQIREHKSHSRARPGSRPRPRQRPRPAQVCVDIMSVQFAYATNPVLRASSLKSTCFLRVRIR